MLAQQCLLACDWQPLLPAALPPYSVAPALTVSHLQAQTGGAGSAIRTLPELAMAMRSADIPSGSDSDGEERQSSAPSNGTGAAAAAAQTEPGPAFAG